MRFRKKPVVVEAFQLSTPDTPRPDWFEEAMRKGEIDLILQGSAHPVYAEVHTAEGRMLATPGDWIIKGVEGELYPCKNSIFQKTYDFDADGVIDTWAGNWIVRVDAPNGLFAEHMLDRDAMEAVIEPKESVANTARTLFNQLWPRRNEVREGQEKEHA